MSIWGNPIMLGGSGGGGGSTIIPKTFTANGTYNASADNADGYDPVVVNVSGGSTYNIHPVSVINSGNLLFEAELDRVSNGVSGLSIAGSMSAGVLFGSANCIFAELPDATTNVTIYALIKSLVTSSSDYAGIGCYSASSTGNSPNIYTRSSKWRTSVYGSGDSATNISSTVYRVLSIALDHANKTCDYYIDGVAYGTKTYNNHGKYPSITGCTNNGTSVSFSSYMEVHYAAIAAEYHDSTTVIANHQALMTRYSSIIGT